MSDCKISALNSTLGSNSNDVKLINKVAVVILWGLRKKIKKENNNLKGNNKSKGNKRENNASNDNSLWICSGSFCVRLVLVFSVNVLSDCRCNNPLYFSVKCDKII